MTARAAKLLIELTQGGEAPEDTQILPFELIVRGSTTTPSGRA
jgi:DNA-binding LacI/PurR family transcriptional regulator